MRDLRRDFILLVLAGLGSVGFADCHSSFSIFRYDLDKCPEQGYSIPKTITAEKLKIEEEQISVDCAGFRKFHLLTEDPKKKQGTIGYHAYAKVKRNSGCELVVAIELIGANTSPSDSDQFRVAEPAADLYAKHLLQGSSTSASVPAKAREFASGDSDFQKWCGSK